MFLSIERIGKSYGSRVLEDVSFSVEGGELVSIVGPSGAGKTTLLKIIAGLETPDHGAIRSEADLRRNPAILVFQDYLLFPTMRLFQAWREGGSLPESAVRRAAAAGRAGAGYGCFPLYPAA